MSAAAFLVSAGQVVLVSGRRRVNDDVGNVVNTGLGGLTKKKTVPECNDAITTALVDKSRIYVYE